jgi:TonB-dependent SusC/RagA subfamily outer membrane receptor
MNMNMKMKRKKQPSLLLFYCLAIMLWWIAPHVTFASVEQEGDRINVSGYVKNSQGEALIGATIKVKGEPMGTVTDINGFYTLKDVAKNAVLEFSYVGFQSQEVPIEGRSRIDVVLMDNLQLQEVVVVGYGTVKKSDLTGSVASIKTDVVKDIPANSIEGLLQGRAAGLQIVNSSQDPGAGSIVRIRGASSLRGSNSPLIVVDGFPLGEAGDLKQINPIDIESVEILKDASASAIYGSRGANGVILVTTKEGRIGKPSIQIKQQLVASEFTSKLNLWRDPVLMALLSNEARTNAGLSPLYVGEVSSTGIYYPSVEELMTTWKTNTRWDDLVFRDAPLSNSTFDKSGIASTFNLI